MWFRSWRSVTRCQAAGSRGSHAADGVVQAQRTPLGQLQGDRAAEGLRRAGDPHVVGGPGRAVRAELRRTGPVHLAPAARREDRDGAGRPSRGVHERLEPALQRGIDRPVTAVAPVAARMGRAGHQPGERRGRHSGDDGSSPRRPTARERSVVKGTYGHGGLRGAVGVERAEAVRSAPASPSIGRPHGACPRGGPSGRSSPHRRSPARTVPPLAAACSGSPGQRTGERPRSDPGRTAARGGRRTSRPPAARTPCAPAPRGIPCCRASSPPAAW